MGKLSTPIIFGAIAILGAVSLGIIALHQGESISAVWMVVAAVCTYAIAYRFYARFLANKVLKLDAARPTPARTRACIISPSSSPPSTRFSAPAIT